MYFLNPVILSEVRRTGKSEVEPCVKICFCIILYDNVNTKDLVGQDEDSLSLGPCGAGKGRREASIFKTFKYCM